VVEADTQQAVRTHIVADYMDDGRQLTPEEHKRFGSKNITWPGIDFTTLDEDGKTKVDLALVLRLLREKYKCKTPDDTEELYVYQNGIYVPGDVLVKQDLEAMLKDKATEHLCKEIIAHLARGSYCKRDEFNIFRGHIPMLNGLYDLFSTKLSDFNPDEIYTFRWNVNYDLNGDASGFKAALMDILPEEDQRRLLQEFLGYVLYPGMPFHKMLFMYGTGRNGKGTIARVMQGLIPPEHRSAVPLEALDGSNRFQVANLFGSLMNVCSEPATSKAFHTELLKKIMGEDDLDGEVKNVQKPRRFRNMAKFIIMGNRFPRVIDQTLSWWDRLLYLKFSKTYTQEQGNQVPDIEQKWLKEESSGIFNWLVEGFERLIENRAFTNTAIMRELRLQFKLTSDSAGAFIEARTDIKASLSVQAPDLYAAYTQYCEDNTAYVESTQKFGRRIMELPGVRQDTPKIGGKTVRLWKGIGLKPTTDTTDTTDSTLPESLAYYDKKEGEINAVETVESLEDQPSASLPTCGYCGKPVEGMTGNKYRGTWYHAGACIRATLEGEAPPPSDVLTGGES
jgi:putative DNA primase/helicase